MGSNISSPSSSIDSKIHQSNSATSCPIVSNNHNNTNSQTSSSSSVVATAATIESSSSESLCPVKYKNPSVFNVSIYTKY